MIRQPPLSYCFGGWQLKVLKSKGEKQRDKKVFIPETLSWQAMNAFFQSA
jgi:hypothetical protein